MQLRMGRLVALVEVLVTRDADCTHPLLEKCILFDAIENGTACGFGGGVGHPGHWLRKVHIKMRISSNDSGKACGIGGGFGHSDTDYASFSYKYIILLMNLGRLVALVEVLVTRTVITRDVFCE